MVLLCAIHGILSSHFLVKYITMHYVKVLNLCQYHGSAIFVHIKMFILHDTHDDGHHSLFSQMLTFTYTSYFYGKIIPEKYRIKLWHYI